MSIGEGTKAARMGRGGRRDLSGAPNVAQDDLDDERRDEWANVVPRRARAAPSVPAARPVGAGAFSAIASAVAAATTARDEQHQRTHTLDDDAGGRAA